MNKIKRLLLMCMFITMTSALPIHSLASEGTTITQDSQGKSGNTNVDYNIEETYTVVFPASVTFTDAETSVERGLLVSDVLLREGSSLKVYVASLNDFKMKNGEGFIDYQLLINYVGTPEEHDYNILTVNAGEDPGWVVLYFTTELNKDNAVYAGRYTDTLTFTVSID